MREEWTGSGIGDHYGEIRPSVIGQWIGRLLGECAKGFVLGIGFAGGMVIILRLFGASS